MRAKGIKYTIKEQEHWYHLLDSTVWNEFKFRDDDIIINAYSKSGTTWVQQIIAQLLWNGVEHIVVSDVSPWLDCRFQSKKERLASIEAQVHRRFIKSHLPVEAKTKLGIICAHWLATGELHEN